MNKKIIFLIISIILSVVCLPLGLTWLTCAIYLGIVLYFAYLNNEYTVICFFILSIFQNIVLVIFSKYISNTYMIILLAIKELLIYCSVLISFYRLFRNKKIKEIIMHNKMTAALLCIYCCCVLINSFKTTAGIKSVIFSIRQMCIPIACVFMGYLLNADIKGIDKIKKMVIGMSIFLVIFGIIEMLLPENIIWQKLNYEVFLSKKQQGEVDLYKGVTGNFYTWDLGFKIRRLVSITADPLATSHIITLGLFTLLFLCKWDMSKQKFIYVSAATVLIIGILLGISKGALVYMAVMIFGIIYHRYLKNISVKTALTVIGSFSVIAVILVCILYFTASHPTALTNHIDGLINGIKGTTVWGNGMGTVGAANGAITGAEILNSESYVGVCLNQIGIIGMGAAIIIWIKMVIFNVKKYFKYSTVQNLFMVILMCGLTIDMLLSESSVSIIGTGIYFIYIGIMEKNREVQ